MKAMANAVEIESKILIDEKEYDKLARKLTLSQPVTQTNWYIDSDDRILSNGPTRLGLRIRLINGEYWMTLKAPMAVGLLEKEQLLSPSEAEGMIGSDIFPEGDIKDFLSDLLDVDTSSLKTLAKMETERRRGFLGDDNSIRLALDRNIYLGRIDYELEIDGDSLERTEKAAKEILKGYKFTFNKLSKQTRCLRALDGGTKADILHDKPADKKAPKVSK